ncbi:MAG: 16S rRNA (cytosine(1402)-N(4))-methyltransferase RsmH [Alphaproteobacteria bacterium]
MNAAGHVPVLLDEVIDALAPRADAVYLDATFGGGGYARALLEAAPCRVWAIDRDPDAVARGRSLARAFPGRLTMIEGRFGALDRLLGAVGVAAVDGVALDLGVSSFQLDDPTRGFSFQGDGPLDLRMGRAGPSAADLVNGAPEERLADILRAYGEERRAGAVARAIVRARATKPIERTLELAEIVRSVVRRAADGLDPATRTFQALRIAVNDELGELEQALAAAERILVAGGRLVVVAFHSLEDGIVKRFFVARGDRKVGASRHAPPVPATRPATFLPVTRKPVRPGAAELAANPRARSARVRAAERTAAPAWEAAA